MTRHRRETGWLIFATLVVMLCLMPLAMEVIGRLMR